MAASGTTSTTSCTFTSSFSTWDGKQFADCCATSKPFKFVFCDRGAANDSIFLNEESGTWRWRHACPCCYDFKVPDVKPAMSEGYAQRAPLVKSIYELFVLADPETIRREMTRLGDAAIP